jgi:hypothetical protein
MPIIIVCPNCHCKMSVPDSLAGKHGKCSKCKGPVTVPGGNGAAAAPAKAKDSSPAAPPPAGKPARGPAPASASANPPAEPPATPPATEAPADLEAAAMSVLGDEPAVAAKAATAIEFECPMCFEPVKLGLEHGGKKHPCPHCKRIIAVPMPKIEDRASWRDTGAKLPSAARRDDEPAPEGAWGSTTKTGPSHEALQEAGVIKEKFKPKTLVQKIAPYVVVGVPLLLLGGGGFALWSWLASGKEKEAFDTAMKYATNEKSPAIERAGLHAGAAVYHLHSGRPGSAGLAHDEILKASSLAGASRSPEGDAMLVDLASVTLDLGGTDEEIANNTRLKWDEVQKTLRAVLGGITAPPARVEALRRVSGALAERGQTARVLPLATQLHAGPGPERIDALATVGLELLRLGHKDEATKAGDRAEEPFKQKKDRPALRLSVVALAIGLSRTPPPPAKKGGDDEVPLQLGRALAKAREGKLAEARAAIKESVPDPADQARVQLAAAVAAVENKQADKAALESILPECREAAKKHGWDVLLFIDAALRAGVPAEGVEPAVAALRPPYAAWGRLLQLRAHLSASRSLEPVDVLERYPANTLAGSMARLELSRHNMRRDSGWYNTVKGWENADLAFGSLGVAQGMQKK